MLTPMCGHGQVPVGGVNQICGHVHCANQHDVGEIVGRSSEPSNRTRPGGGGHGSTEIHGLGNNGISRSDTSPRRMAL